MVALFSPTRNETTIWDFASFQDMLEYAFQDDVFDSEHIRHPRDIWLYSDVPQHRLSVPIHIRDCKRDIPIFRPAVQDSEGNWVTHPTMALPYAQAAEDEKRACKSIGKEPPIRLMVSLAHCHQFAKLTIIQPTQRSTREII